MDDRWTEEKILKAIKHYQDSVTKYAKAENEAKILHAIKRLYDLPITVKHLKDTGVGRTINALRKFDGDVGHASRSIVQKWKNMVVEEDKDVEQNEETDEDEPDDLNEQDEHEQKENVYKQESDDEPTHTKKHRSKHRHNSEDSDEVKNHRSYDDKHKKHRHDSDKHKNHKHETDKHDKYSVGEHKSHKSDHSHRSSHNSSSDKKHSKHDKEHRHKERDKNDRKRKHDDESTSSSKKKRYITDNEDSEDAEIEENDESSHLYKSQNDDSDRSPEPEEVIKHKSSSSSSSSSKHKSSKKHKKEKDERDSKKHNGYDEHSSKKENSDKTKKSKDKSSRSKETKDSKESGSKSSSSNNSSSNKEKSSSNGSSSSSSNAKSSHHEDKHKKSEKYDKDKEKKSNKSVSKIKKDINITEDGIDCGSGASFAEALGMMEDVPTIRTTFTKKKSKPDRHKSPEPSTSKVTSSNKPSTSRSHTNSPSLLLSSNVKLEPLELNLTATLPEITTNYKPLPVNYSYESDTPMRPINHMTEEEALDYVITSKTQRTKVYSGVKTWRYVPSLFNLCVNILQNHIDSLEYTGGVPFSILKPVLEKATPTQLFNVENHNPYLIDDTDTLWELHCKKLFKGKVPQEMESWRDMYLRCCDEREAKLKSLTKNIKISQEKSLPVRQTKLAYVDSIVKPPRAVARKQAKFGTASSASTQPLVTPTSRLKAVAAAKSSNVVTVPPPPQQRTSSSSSSMIKPKKAPLMQKALAAIKSRFRR